MRKVLALYDTNTTYASRFLEYLNKQQDVGFVINVFTKIESLKEFLLHSPIEILLLGEELSLEDLEGVRLILYLDDEGEDDPEADCPRILRYQSAKAIWKNIQSYYYKRLNQMQSSRHRSCNIITIYSPLPGKTGGTLSWYLAQSLADKQKVLYIPMELFPISDHSASTVSGDALSTFIYYLKDGTSNLTEKTNTLLKYQGRLPYLSGLTHGLDLLSLNKEDAARWVKILQQNSGYELVIFYLSFYSDFVIELLSQSSKTIVLTEDNPYAKSLIREWKRQMEVIGTEIKEPSFRILYQPYATSDRLSDDESVQQNNDIRQLAVQEAMYLSREENL